MGDLDYCPFCGNEWPELLDEGDTWGVYCGFCNAKVTGYISAEAAVERWNHRYKPEKEEAEK